MSEAKQISLRVLEIAVSRGTLTADQLETLLTDGGDVCDLAVERDLIGAAEIELLRPLAESTTYLPDYEIVELIGDGGAGAVYRARQTKLDRMVALKLLKPSVIDDSNASARSQLEAQVGGSLQHPNVVAVHDYGVHRQRVYIALELVEGDTVLDVIEESGPIDPTISLQITRQVAAALKYASSKGVVHRDIKPANLLLTSATAGIEFASSDNKAVKVTDFGLAFRTGGKEATRLTAAGATLGTPSYVAPEQLEDTNVDHRADIYALGASLFHMVTGKQPFAGGNAFLAIAAKMQGSEEWREKMDESIPEPIRQLIADMTHHSPDERLQDHQIVADRIDAILNNELHLIPTRRKRRKKTKWLLATAIGLGVGCGALFWFTKDATDPAKPVQVTTERVGQPIPLFRRDAVPFLRIRPSRGSLWTTAKDTDGVGILSGKNGWKMFPIDKSGEHPGYIGIRVTANPLEDSAADICFARNEAGDCAVVRIAGGIAQLGLGNLDEFEFQQVPATRTVKLRAGRDGENDYQVVYLERQPGGWFVSVNNERLGELPAIEGDYDMFYLRAKGMAHFSEIAEIKNRPTDPQLLP